MQKVSNYRFHPATVAWVARAGRLALLFAVSPACRESRVGDNLSWAQNNLGKSTALENASRGSSATRNPDPNWRTDWEKC
jgi:hypothetical protein